jgi:hypothetical protein
LYWNIVDAEFEVRTQVNNINYISHECERLSKHSPLKYSNWGRLNFNCNPLFHLANFGDKTLEDLQA